MNKWTFYDPVTLDSYLFHVNPNEGGSPEYAKTISYAETTAPGGNVLMFEGADPPRHGSFSGTILERDQYEAMVEWFNKRYIIRIIDDLNREFDVIITKFSARRQRAVHYQYKHTYTVDYTIVQTTST